MIRSLIRCGAVAGAVAFGACKLEVANPNSPGTAQVKQSPADLENYLGSQYRRWHSALYGTTGNIWGMAAVQSFEDFSTLSNNCMGQRVGIPRAGNDNSVGNGCSGEQSRVYNQHNEVARAMAEVLRRLNTTGFTFSGSTAQDLRGRAFAEFLRGISLGYLALVYDSASIVTPQDSLSSTGTALAGVLSGYQDVMAAAIVALDSSVAAATAAAARPATEPQNFPLPPTWMFSVTSMTSAEFIKVVRSYRARLRAGVARNPAERAAVDWSKVIADAQNGITADHLITTNTVTGPNMSWTAQWYSYTTWHEMTPFIVGMADKTGAYGTWIAAPLTTRGVGTPFFMQTDDQRFPQGATRALQQADFALTSCNGVSQVCKRFFLNRQTSDPASSPSWGASQYDHVRFISWVTSGSGTGQNGPFRFFTQAELDMLQAEGMIRTGNYAAAAALIDKTRAACGPGSVPAGCVARPTGDGSAGDPGGGLPKLTGAVLDGTTPVPGGASCVPRVPVNATNAGGGTTTCGNMFEAMKWEKRVETAYTHFAGWFFDSRGWGDLVVGTPVHWAPPYQDLQSRLRVGTQIYSVGGPNPTGGAAVSGYGW